MASTSNYTNAEEGDQATTNGLAAPVLQDHQSFATNGETASPSSESAVRESAGLEGKLPCIAKKPRNPAVLILWIEEHAHNPYPSRSEKTMLAHYAGMTQRQLNDWFANARRNIKKVGYSAWKEKHPAYSARFSLGNVSLKHPPTESQIETGQSQSNGAARAEESDHYSTPGLPTATDAAATYPMATTVGHGPGGNRLRILTNYPLKGDPASISSHSRASSGLNHHQLASYLGVVTPPTTLMSASHSAHPSASMVNVNTLQSMAPAAYYKLPQPLNFKALGQPIIPAGRSNLLQPQYAFDTTSPWSTPATSSAKSPLLHAEKLLVESAAYPAPHKTQTDSHPERTKSPMLRDVAPTMSLSENESGVSGQREPLQPPVSPTVVASVSSWDVTQPQSTATQQLFTDYQVTSQAAGPHEMGTQWPSTTVALLYNQQSYHH